MPRVPAGARTRSRAVATAAAAAAAALACHAVAAQQRPAELPTSLVLLHTWSDGATLRATAADSAVGRQLVANLDDARRVIAEFFGTPFRSPVAVTLVPDRAAFSRFLRVRWGVPDTQCWMVATGVGDAVVVLSPRVWMRDACEHDAGDAQHVRDILTHELVHSFHGQHSPSPDFDFPGAEEIGWFIEGLATYVARQLDRERLATARDALAAGAAPAALEQAWSGRFRYGVSGSLVQYIDQAWGRATVRELLAQTSESAILALLDRTEAQLLESWAAWVRRR